jgi:hypothetical protein
VTDELTVAKELCSPPVTAGDAGALLPREPGLYAWWASPDLLPGVSGPAHLSIDGLELLYIGLAQNLRTEWRATTSVGRRVSPRCAAPWWRC